VTANSASLFFMSIISSIFLGFFRWEFSRNPAHFLQKKYLLFRKNLKKANIEKTLNEIKNLYKFRRATAILKKFKFFSLNLPTGTSSSV
jgi:hypothetical protein